MTAPIRRARINHLEVTVAAGTLTALMPDLAAFYGDALGFGQVEIDAFPKPHVFLTTDAYGGNFIYIAEHAEPMKVGGEDHLGFHMDSRELVDEVLAACRAVTQRDPRMQIKELDDLDLPQTVTHAFYFRYLLPIWFDIQIVESKPGFEPKQRWVLTEN